MYKFSQRSLDNLETCCAELQLVAHEAIKYEDFSVIEGHRSLERQRELYEQGKSKIDGVTLTGMHNSDPSQAFDLLPYPPVLNGVNIWKDKPRFYLFAGFIKGVALANGVELRLGADWDGDGSTNDQTFHDLPHFEFKGTL